MSNYQEDRYLQLLRDCARYGQEVTGRNGHVTRSLFGRQLDFDLTGDKLPLLTTKKVFLKGIIHELLWFLKGSTNNNDLKANGVSIWDEWAAEDGELGPIYGHQWRAWTAHDPDDARPRYVDQIEQVIRQLQGDPHGRRHIVSAWNVGDIPEMALPPCHCLFQFYVGPKGLECQLYQRSADMFLGVPFNIASYAILTKMIAQVVGLKAAKLIITFGDVHIYKDHIPMAMEQTERNSRQFPTLTIHPEVSDIDSFTYNDFQLHDYYPHAAIKADVHK